MTINEILEVIEKAQAVIADGGKVYYRDPQKNNLSLVKMLEFSGARLVSINGKVVYGEELKNLVALPRGHFRFAYIIERER